MNNDFKRFWAWPDELAQSGVLGINRRNVGIIFEHNPRHRYPSVGCSFDGNAHQQRMADDATLDNHLVELATQ